MPHHKSSYTARAASFKNPTASRLLKLMDEKQTNLSIAADVTTKAELLKLADVLGPYICVFKTHIDIVTDFDQDLIKQLEALAQKHNFLIFEDRKFADIGNTVKHQYSQGVYHIASWSDITNAHPLPGEGIIKGLKEVGLPLSRGLLLLAEMSSAGSLAKGAYSEEAVRMARRNRDFVIGFIGQRRLSVPLDAGQEQEDDFLYLTPGVSMAQPGDSLGQQYRSPEQVILESECDVIIVGRGIYGAADPVAKATEYREAGWAAYQKRLGVSQ
ncbi:orotidine 5'-phosphate decarboxylase [Spizellomyces punctatus DAOM BR117]|uniref:Orotidine 5'-phosphate decarboxylase n=1 Tax=Spizellomyces punctatus (strain DAOM BR117) TaxID=645134 RepID=A0A0L0HJ56_SPIPD|nr:orotidine 5'-phosphate decarboxylase [Spizellomyces punctatus DAOM BR117]KND01127.1 orotidine 5'-phosphate decarboxylase [Spizellomyces punctatus DAOM BR117]|eukprot:XP_016609166.1 orotidine 5'-phosphate decarboxylase [Spizellomyces punctatus DAOM BR117]